MKRAARWLPALLLATPHIVRAESSDTSDVTIRGVRPREAPGATTLPAERAAEGAGTQGDPVKALQSLPGVGRGSAAEAEPVLWGSTPSESRVYVDGVELPLLFHGSGVRSVLPTGALGTVSSVPGAFGAEHGRALGGLVELTTRPPRLDAARLQVSADLLDATVRGSAPLTSIAGAVELAARYGYVDRWLPPLIDPSLRGLYRVPSYWDAEAQLSQRLDAQRSLRWVALTSSDEVRNEQQSADPARRQTSEKSQRFGRLYLQYEAHDGDDTRDQLTPFVGWDEAVQALDFGPNRASLRTPALRYGLRARHDERLQERLGLSLGLDASGSVGHVQRAGSFFVPPREGSPYPFGTAPGSSYAVDDYRAHVLGVAAWLETPWRVTSALQVTPSLRFEPTLIEVSHLQPPAGGLPEAGGSRIEAALEPRLSADARLSAAARLFGAVGRYHQPPALADLSARFGNPSLPLASGTHAALGESVTLPTRTRVEVVVFLKELRGLATPSNRQQPELGKSLVASGAGRAFGSQLFVRQPEVAGLSGWLSVTLSRSERRDADGSLRLSDYDTPLVVAAAASQRAGAWRIGARARFASGAPRTPVVGSYFDLAAQRYQPLLGAPNSIRLRDFFQLDLRVDRRFELGRAGSLELYIDALNVTFRRNQEELAYSSDFRRIGSVTGLPSLAVVGATFER